MDSKTILRSNRHALRRLLATVCVVISLSAVGNANAQWQVVDNDANRTLSEIKDRLGDGNVNENLEKLHEQQQIGAHQSAGEQAKDPEEVLDKDKPMGTVMTDIGVDQRCPPTDAQGVAQQQWQLCQLIVQTELAQYKYSLKMYETAKQRYERLKAIQDERSNIGADEQGKLQDNSNKLLALLSLLEIDRQQQRSYMDAYAARLNYLKAARDTLTKQALSGNPNAATSIIGGEILAGALALARTGRRYNP